MIFTMLTYPNPEEELPALTAEQMLQVDRLMIETYHIEQLQMMENAGRCLAALGRERFWGGEPRGKRVVVLAGSGGNGSGALAGARRLHNWGAQVQILLARPAEAMAPAPRQLLYTLQRLGIPVILAGQQPEQPEADLLLDGLLGYSLRGAPHGGAAALIEWANRLAAPPGAARPAPLLALDLPSGLDATSGEVHSPCIRATATLTLALPKLGLMNPQAAGAIGELYLADISVPPELYARLGFQVGPLFARSEILRLG